MEEVPVENKANASAKKTIKTPEENRSGCGTALVGWFFVFFVLGLLIWNWDGFWQTNIGPLNKVQNKYFPKKYANEQFKMATALNNSAIFNDINRKYHQAIIDAENYQESLVEIKRLAGQRCSYLKTSLMMLDLAKELIPAEHWRRSIRCTNAECVNILTDQAYVIAICDGL